MKVVLAWGLKKRHIAVDGKILCEPEFSATAIYRGANGNSLATHGIPSEKKNVADTKWTHTDGEIPPVRLDEVRINNIPLIQSSICAKCKQKYGRISK